MMFKSKRLTFLVKEAKNNNQEAMLLLIQRFHPKLQASLYQTTIEGREDLMQELNVKMIEAVGKYNLDSAPGFHEFLERVEKIM